IESNSYGDLHKHLIVICNLMWLFNASLWGLYTSYTVRKLERIYRGTVRSFLMHALLFSLYLWIFNNTFSLSFLVVFYGGLAATLITSRFGGTVIQFVFLKKFKLAKKIAVMGSNSTAVRIATYFSKHRSVEYYGSVGDDDSIYAQDGDVMTQKVSEKLAEAAANGVMDVYVAVAPERMADVKALLLEAEKQCVRLKFIPDFAGAIGSPYTVSYLGGEFPIITLRNEPLEEMGNRVKKRAFDILFSACVILFVLSWLYPLLALIIKMQSRGPVLFKQLRSGRNDEPFWCYKFRSMKINNDSDKKQATRDDDRVTAIGKFMRRTSLDEMPQFFNVFLGNMSVVGPRPHMLKHTEEYKAIIDQYMVRQFLKPGITGWAQVNGFRGETKTSVDMENRVKCDIYYLENWSTMLDVRIIFMTVINIAHGEKNAF
ncbi:MAG: exopolysaccharide biosynthesis polyprenyl glycosylphosphotransferase, partial [Pedobacter sp.]